MSYLLMALYPDEVRQKAHEATKTWHQRPEIRCVYFEPSNPRAKCKFTIVVTFLKGKTWPAWLPAFIKIRLSDGEIMKMPVRMQEIVYTSRGRTRRRPHRQTV